MRLTGLHARCAGVVVVQPVLEMRDDSILAQRLPVSCARCILPAFSSLTHLCLETCARLDNKMARDVGPGCS